MYSTIKTRLNLRLLSPQEIQNLYKNSNITFHLRNMYVSYGFNCTCGLTCMSRPDTIINQPINSLLKMPITLLLNLCDTGKRPNTTFEIFNCMPQFVVVCLLLPISWRNGLCRVISLRQNYFNLFVAQYCHCRKT